MGYCVTAYRVNFSRLKQLRGSRNQQMLSELRTEARELTAYDDDEDDDDWDDDGPIAGLMGSLQRLIFGRVTLEKAIERFINGQSLAARDAAVYTNALHLIIRHTSEMLNNSAVAPAPPQHFTDVDEALKKNGIDTNALSMSNLIFGGPPIDIPPWDDFPQVGHMTPEAVKAAKGRITTKDWTPFTQEVQDTVALMDRWIDEASSNREGLVCFYQ